MPLPSQRKYDAAHLKHIEQYSAKVRKAYLKAIAEVSKLAVPLSLNPNDEFYFRNYPDVSKKVDNVMKSLYTEVYGTTVAGINSEWDLAVEKNNELTNYVYGSDLDNLPEDVRNEYLSSNSAARKAFIGRKDNGYTISEKVWKNTRQFKNELELALEVGIGSGKSADSISRTIRPYLNEPDKLFRKVKDKKTGALRLSKAAASYHPGQGVYRSSYKNAFRLTRNEVNFSYEESQQQKRNQQDFVVGTEIHTSSGHNPKDDKGGISCRSLAGNYPKNFKWTYKWHVSCKCYSTSILKTRDELDKDTDKILAGGTPDTKSSRAVIKQPDNYTSYVRDNRDLWKNWKNKPRFLG